MQNQTRHPRLKLKKLILAVASAIAGMSLLAASGASVASSHREAPFITTMPKVDATDFYMFRSYEAGRSGFTTLMANYLPLQDAYGGPNTFPSILMHFTKFTLTTSATQKKKSLFNSDSRTR